MLSVKESVVLMLMAKFSGKMNSLPDMKDTIWLGETIWVAEFPEKCVPAENFRERCELAKKLW